MERSKRVKLLSRKREAVYQKEELLRNTILKAKIAVTTMLTRSKEADNNEDANLTEEERDEKEQRELVPLLTGGRLKSYQIKGLKWLISLWTNGHNGILADQLGTGKTLQTIGFLAHLKGNGLNGPYLVIAPLSTISNWVNGISRFAPSMDAIIYHGSRKQRDDIRRKHMPTSTGSKFPIIVTSYEISLWDAKKSLRHYPWKYVVVDEELVLPNLLNAGGDIKEMEGQSRRPQPITPFLLGRNHQPAHSPRRNI